MFYFSMIPYFNHITLYNQHPDCSSIVVNTEIIRQDRYRCHNYHNHKRRRNSICLSEPIPIMTYVFGMASIIFMISSFDLVSAAAPPSPQNSHDLHNYNLGCIKLYSSPNDPLFVSQFRLADTSALLSPASCTLKCGHNITSIIGPSITSSNFDCYCLLNESQPPPVQDLNGKCSSICSSANNDQPCGGPSNTWSVYIGLDQESFVKPQSPFSHSEIINSSSEESSDVNPKSSVKNGDANPNQPPQPVNPPPSSNPNDPASPPPSPSPPNVLDPSSPSANGDNNMDNANNHGVGTPSNGAPMGNGTKSAIGINPNSNVKSRGNFFTDNIVGFSAGFSVIFVAALIGIALFIQRRRLAFLNEPIDDDPSQLENQMTSSFASSQDQDNPPSSPTAPSISSSSRSLLHNNINHMPLSTSSSTASQHMDMETGKHSNHGNATRKRGESTVSTTAAHMLSVMGMMTSVSAPTSSVFKENENYIYYQDTKQNRERGKSYVEKNSIYGNLSVPTKPLGEMKRVVNGRSFILNEDDKAGL